MSIVKGLVLRGWTSMYPELARVEKVSPKTYLVKRLRVAPTGEVVELWRGRWRRNQCVPVTEAMLKLLQELARLNALYEQKVKEIRDEHEGYGKPIVRAIQEEIEKVRTSSERALSAADSGTTTPDAPSSG